ncbi:MAG: hypothetical protein PHY62_00935 [Gallionella sp.]|nr:hypothetical protein [Gallionella sp.]
MKSSALVVALLALALTACGEKPAETAAVVDAASAVAVAAPAVVEAASAVVDAASAVVADAASAVAAVPAEEAKK